MLSMTTGQVGFFDLAELIGPVPEGSFFALLAEHGERIVRDGDFADCYSESVGQGPRVVGSRRSAGGTHPAANRAMRE